MKIFSSWTFVPLLAALLVLQGTARPVYAITCNGASTAAASCQADVTNNATAPDSTVSEGIHLSAGQVNILFNSYPFLFPNDSPSLCRFVDNNSANNYFVPQNTSAEFSAFLNNLPEGVVLGNCVLPVSSAASTFAATASISYPSFQIFQTGGPMTPLGNKMIATVANIAVPQNQSIMRVDLGPYTTTAVNVVNQDSEQPIQFLYTREDCRVDLTGATVCNTWSIKEDQTLTFTAMPGATTDNDGSWVGATTSSSTWFVQTITGQWTSITGPYADYQPPGLQSCTVGGVTYDDGATWTTSATSAQTPTSTECPYGAGTRVDDMQTITSYTCDDSDAQVTGIGSPTETGFTGACAAQSQPMTVAAIDQSSGGSYACAILSGSLFCWGDNTSGQLGIGSSSPGPYTTPQQVGTATNWTAISTNLWNTTCGISGGALYCWGSTNSSATPQQVGSAYDWSAISAANAVCGIEGGNLYCWGENTYGQMGVNTTSASWQPVPQQVTYPSAAGWSAVSPGGWWDTCAINNGKLYCAGLNSQGDLALGYTDEFTFNFPEFQPAAGPGMPPLYYTSSGVPLTNWTAVSLGVDYFGCGIAGGALYCWGQDYDGVMGIPYNSPAWQGIAPSWLPIPEQVGSATNWTAVSAGAFSACGVSDGALYCWGWNGEGELGLGNTSGNEEPSEYFTPQQVGTSASWTNVSAGQHSTCAVDSCGYLYCWGDNTYGELGTGNTTAYYTPQLVSFPGQSGSDSCLAPVGGQCGSADGVAVDTAPSSGLCTAGTPSAVAAGASGPWTWTCAGANGGTAASCSAPYLAAVGVCGSANGVPTSLMPASNLCNSSNASAVSGSGPWIWTCDGSSTNATCAAAETTITGCVVPGGTDLSTGFANNATGAGFNVEGTSNTGSITGNSDDVGVVGGSDNVTITGNGNSICEGGGSDSVTLNGSNDYVIASGSGDNIALTGANSNVVTSGSDDTGTMALTGANNTVDMTGSEDNLTITGPAGSSLVLNISGSIDTVSISGGIAVTINFNACSDATITVNGGSTYTVAHSLGSSNTINGVSQ